ncbi:MAG: type VI secretion system baseplate subunit TssG [Spirochaetaceae bacterium]|jgi:type VI secretion system protein ImpH|nr:type VI secretion system baseplate subunit TssG [Spirochaetaceae bacterium]
MENIRRVIKSASLALKNGTRAPDFWAFIRSLENANPGLPRLGKAKRPADENVRFGQIPYLHFTATEIAEIIEGGRQAGVDATVLVYFFGLLGIQGPMPLEFTSYVFRRSRSHYDNTWRRFLDIINHRFLTLFYRAYSSYQQCMNFDRPEDDQISRIIKALSGIPPVKNIKTGTFAERGEAIALSCARYFSFQLRNRSGLLDMLRSIFTYPIEVDELVAARYDIPPSRWAVLGRPQTSTLGRNCQIGRFMLSITGNFEIRIGPISFDQYNGFMMGHSGFDLLTEAVNLYLDRPVAYSILFIINSFTIPIAQLGFDLEEGTYEAARLGYTCWIGSLGEDEVCLRINASRLVLNKHKEKEAAKKAKRRK